MNDGAYVVVLLLTDNYATMKAITMPEQWYIKKKGARMWDVSVGKMEKAQAKRDNAKPVGGPTAELAAIHNQVIMEKQQQL